MGLETSLLEIRTGRTTAVSDVTNHVVAFCRGKGDGLLNVFLPHATAGLALMEIGSGAEDDLLATLEDLLPRTRPYRHQHGSPGHGADHVLPALISPSLTIPVFDGRLALGTWQSVVVIDPNRDNSVRQLCLSFLAG